MSALDKLSLGFQGLNYAPYRRAGNVPPLHWRKTPTDNKKGILGNTYSRFSNKKHILHSPDVAPDISFLELSDHVTNGSTLDINK